MKRTLHALLSVILAAALTGCGSDSGGGGGISITINNMTGYVLSDIRIAPENTGEWGDNYLSGDLDADASADITLGSYSEEETADGYAIQLFDAYDSSIGAAHNLMLVDGDILSLYIDGMGDLIVETSNVDEPAAQ